MIEIIWNATRQCWCAYVGGVVKEQREVASSKDQINLVGYLLVTYPDRKIVIRPKV